MVLSIRQGRMSSVHSKAFGGTKRSIHAQTFVCVRVVSHITPAGLIGFVVIWVLDSTWFEDLGTAFGTSQYPESYINLL